LRACRRSAHCTITFGGRVSY